MLDAGNDGEDGFIHRILYVYPKKLTGRTWNWEGLSPGTSKLWDDIVHRLHELEMDQDGNGRPAPCVLDFEPEARPLWQEWFDAHAAEAEAADFDEMLKCFWPKAVAYAARLSLVVHLLRAACGEQVGEDVDLESLRRGLRLIEYFQSHSAAVYAHLRLPKEATQIRRAIDWIREHGGECNPTKLVQNGVAGCAAGRRRWS